MPRQTCTHPVLRRRSDPWAPPGSLFRSACGAPASLRDPGTGEPRCPRHLPEVLTDPPDPSENRPD